MTIKPRVIISRNIALHFGRLYLSENNYNIRNFKIPILHKKIYFLHRNIEMMLKINESVKQE